MCERITVKRGRSERSELNIGLDVASYVRCKSRSGRIVLNALEGANVETLNRLEVSPNARIRLAQRCKDISKRASRFLVAGVGRVWLNTVGLISVYCTSPVVSNTMWTVKLVGDEEGWGDLSKIQALWLNSTPGLLNYLALRQDSKGAFIQVKKEYLPRLKLLDISRLTSRQRAAILRLYSRLRRVDVGRLPNQLKDGIRKKGFRYELDSNLIRILEPNFDADQLPDIYEQLLDETIIYVPS